MKTLEQGTRGVMYWWRFENLPWQVAMSDLIFLAMIWARYSAGPGDLQGPYSMIFYVMCAVANPILELYTLSVRYTTIPELRVTS